MIELRYFMIHYFTVQKFKVQRYKNSCMNYAKMRKFCRENYATEKLYFAERTT